MLGRKTVETTMAPVPKDKTEGGPSSPNGQSSVRFFSIGIINKKIKFAKRQNRR